MKIKYPLNFLYNRSRIFQFNSLKYKIDYMDELCMPVFYDILLESRYVQTITIKKSRAIAKRHC